MNDLPHLPQMTILPNLVSSRGFVYGIEPAQLGNALSVFANLIAFSLRTGIPVIYPQIMDQAALFDFSDIDLPYIFNGNRAFPFPVDKPGLLAVQGFIDRIMEGYYENYSRMLHSVAPEWLPDAGLLSHATVFLNHDMNFRDLGDHQSTLARFAARSNAIILPGAYWWQYRELPVKAADTVRQVLRLAHQDSQAQRAALMADPATGVRIGVHARLGDYKDFHGGRYFWETSTYVNLMKTISRQFGERSHMFMLCSNGDFDPAQMAGLPHCFAQGSAFDDFVALANCDYVIGPPSTFATWAAFLGNSKRLVLTEEPIAAMEQIGLEQAQVPLFPTGSGVPGDYWIAP